MFSRQKLLLNIFLIKFLIVSGLVFSQKKIDTSEVYSRLRKAEKLKRENSKEALRIAQEALGICKEKKYPKGIADCNNKIGVVYFILDNYQAAMESQLKAFEYYQSADDETGLAKSLMGMANVYANTSEKLKAIEFFRKALAIQIKLKLPTEITYNNIGYTYYRAKDYDSALIYYHRSLPAAKKSNSAFNIANTLQNIGHVYKERETADSALKYYLLSNEIAQANNLNELHAINLHSLAKIYLLNKNKKKADECARQAVEIGKKNGYSIVLQNSYQMLSEAFYSEGEYKKAIESFRSYDSMRGKNFNVTNASAITKMQMQSDYERKRREEEILVKEKEFSLKASIEKQRIIVVCVSIGLILVLMLAGMAFRAYRHKKAANIQMAIQKDLIEEKQKEILDSIHYAQRIQQTLLASKAFLNENVAECMVFFNPKDIVSGDFYWAAKHNGNFFLAVCDSTGHGVPGAFMSLLSIGFLSEAIKEKDIADPNEVFNSVRKRLVESISKDGQKDGFDGILLCVNEKTGKITYAASNNSPLLISENKITELECDKMPVGKGENDNSFTLRSIEAKKGDMIYLYTDGYADQFGGPKGKKFKYKPLDELLTSISTLPVQQQHHKIAQVFIEWKGKLEQVDDVCVIGIRL